MDWLLVYAALAAAGVIGGKSIAGRAAAAKVAAEYGPLIDSGRIEGFAAILLRTGKTVSEQTADSVLRVHERAILLGDGAHQFANLRRVNDAGSEFEVEQAEGLIRVTVKYPKEMASRVNEALVRAARSQGVRIGVPLGRDPFVRH